jgi:site-specific DNA-methyltransferase (adenine-specific)
MTDKKRARKSTKTSSFGAGKRESHDASAFYARFTPPEISDDAEVVACPVPDQMFVGDSRAMTELPDKCIALVVTSPPYFAGKEYEEDLGKGKIPATYLEYLQMLRDVFAECVRVLEPGGRIAVNVANLGRRPYRSLSSDVTRILQDELRLLLRGELVWHKAKGMSGSTAWGSFMSASNPVLRDLTERIVIASKGRLDRAVARQDRKRLGLPYENSLEKQPWMEATLDVWHIRPESARRVQHPAPFPVQLPERVIELYTYIGDVVLDPFVGSGSTAVAAVRTGRHYVGYDTSADYVATARARVAKERGSPR